MSRILVTGGTGVVGTKLVANLRAKGHDVWISDRGHSFDQNYVRADISEFRQVQNLVEKSQPDLVFNAGAEFGRWNGEAFYESLWRSNVIGLKHVLKVQENQGFKLVHFSSSEVYGDYDGIMSEDVMDNVEIKQMNDYAMTKWVNEQQIQNAEQMTGSQTVRIRIFNTYGPGEYFSEWRSVACRFIFSALHNRRYTVHDGHTRTHTYIDDAVEWISRIESNFKAGDVYNIAGSHRTDIKELSDTILKVLNRSDDLVDYAPSEPMTTKDKIVDNSRMLRALGSHAEIPFEEGIRRTIDWQRQVYGV